jgi:hypothetical protein
MILLIYVFVTAIVYTSSAQRVGNVFNQKGAGVYSYEQVVQFPDFDANTLFEATKEWVASTYKSRNSLITFEIPD